MQNRRISVQMELKPVQKQTKSVQNEDFSMQRCLWLDNKKVVEGSRQPLVTHLFLKRKSTRFLLDCPVE